MPAGPLKGVTFALSGYVNPERSQLREMAMEMGASYRPDWTADATHLLCKFGGTPKIQQAKQSGGKILKGEWIVACDSAQSRVPEKDYLLEPEESEDDDPTDVEDEDADEHDSARSDLNTAPTKKPRMDEADVAPTGGADCGDRTSSAAADVIKQWLMEDLKKFEDYLISEVAGSSDDSFNPKDVARQGIIESFVYAKEDYSEKDTFDNFKEEWEGPVPQGLTAVIDGAKNNSKDEVLASLDRAKSGYEEALKLVS